MLITHFHGDHLIGLPPLLLDLRTFGRRTRPLVVAGPAGVGRAVDDLVQAAFPGFAPGFELRVLEIEDGSTVDVAGFTVEGRAQTHRPESLGYRIAEGRGPMVAFSGDCRFDDGLVGLVDGAAVAFVEVTLPGAPEADIAHVALEEMLGRHGELRAERLVFTHLNDRIADALGRARIGIPARDGLRVEIGAGEPPSDVERPRERRD